MDLVVEHVRHPDSETLDSLSALLSQLSRSAKQLTLQSLTAIVSSDTTTLMVARLGDRMVGTLTLVVFPLPTGVRAWIEDVVVDESARGAGVGAALVDAAIDWAREAGARTVDLTSRPTREAANRLYERLGFQRRSTNVYRIELTDG
ncbi:GNAT family N-acetyltransferase [Streptomyces sp. SID5475]|nr:GNAT family N-acetyltransferase [Streptomyces xinghaiensis]MZE75690.1 GNAT family N-acetyltransferase [Streptomyces sp. SID5475]